MTPPSPQRLNKYAALPVPVVTGGKSRALDKKWKPAPVSMPSTMAFAAAAPRVTAPMMSKAPEKIDTTAAAPQSQAEAPAAAATALTKPDAAPPAIEAAAAAIPVPAANPNAAALIEPAAPPKKKRWWLLGQ